MKKLLVLAAMSVLAVAGHAADAKKELTSQQLLMGTCNREAAGLKGDERKKKVTECLADGKRRQQEKMKACATENKGKKGEEYKKAQKECLSKG